MNLIVWGFAPLLPVSSEHVHECKLSPANENVVIIKQYNDEYTFNSSPLYNCHNWM